MKHNIWYVENKDVRAAMPNWRPFSMAICFRPCKRIGCCTWTLWALWNPRYRALLFAHWIVHTTDTTQLRGLHTSVFLRYHRRVALPVYCWRWLSGHGCFGRHSIWWLYFLILKHMMHQFIIILIILVLSIKYGQENTNTSESKRIWIDWPKVDMYLIEFNIQKFLFSLSCIGNR